jgi:hypothetical protein
MNVAIIGPEGSGKTVLAAVLSEFLQSHPELGLRFRAASIETKNYCGRVVQSLSRQEWPDSTRKGESQHLQWEWGLGGQWHAVQLIDPPGQDVRSALAGGRDDLGLRASIESAHLVILTVDAVAHQSERAEIRVQNGWIVEQLLRLVDLKRSNLIMVLTKADRLDHELDRARWGDRDAVLGTIQRMMPECNLAGYAEQLRSFNCAAIAIAAVETVDEVADGVHLLLPASPLASAGLPRLVGEVTKALLAFESRSSLEAQRGAAAPSPKRKWLLLAVVAALVTLVTVVLASGEPAGDPPEPDRLPVAGQPAVRYVWQDHPCDGCSDGWTWLRYVRPSCGECGGVGTIRREVREAVP